MTSSMLFGDRRMTSSRRSGMTVLGKVPKPVNLPSKRLENHGADPSVEIVPKGTLSWGSRSSSASNAWGSPSLSPKADGGTSPSHLSGHLSPGSGTRPSTAGSDKGHEPSSNAWGSNSRPSSASGALTSNQTTLTSLRPRSADTRPGSSQLSRFAEHSDHPVAWSAPGTAEKLGMMSSKNDGFSLTSGDFPTLGSEKDNPGKSAEPQGEISENANMKGGTANSWKRENPSYNEDGGRHGMEKWQGNPHPYPSANVPPQHYDGWHGGPVNNPQGGVWYRGPPGAPYGAPIPPGGFPMEPFPYYPPGPPQIPPAAIANQQSIPPPGAGPRGHHPKNGDMYRPHMQDAYIRPGMPIRPGFYPGPVAFEGYYNSPRGYCNPNERDVPYVGMTAGPPVYNNYPSQSAHRPAISQGRPSGYGPPNPKLMSEQFESAHPPDSRGPYKVILKQHDGWDRRNEEQRNEGAVTGLSTDASSLEREDHPSTLGAERDWISDHRKEGVRDQRKMVGEEAASRKFDNQGAASVPEKVMYPESLEQIKTVDVISMKKLGTEAYGTPEVAQPLLDAAKDSSLIQKIEGLNAKARVSDGRSDTSSVSTREEQKNRFQVNAKAHNSVNEPVGGGIVNPERSHATESINPSLEVGSTISISRQSNRAMHDNRSDHRGRGRFNNQEGEGWSKKSLVSEPTTVVSTARFEIPYDHLVSTEAIEKSGSYPQGRCEEELAMPLVDPNDSEAQRAKMRELAKQRTKQLQEEEEERTRRQMVKARAKLEELNRRTQVESSNQKIESHSSGAIQIKQEGSQTAGEPLSGGRKSALGSNLDGASLINESSTGKAEKSTVLASDLPSDTLKSVCKEPVLMHDESMPKPKEVIVANVVDHNNAPQAHESNITRVKQAPKQKQNNQLEKKPTGKFTSTSTDDATKCQTDYLVDVSKSLGVVPNETASSSESSQTANPSVILESTSHPRKKNNRIGKNKQKTESTSTAAAMPSSASKETDIANATVESGRPRVSELELDPSSGQSQTIPRDAYHTSEQHLSLSNEESKGKGNSQWKPQHFRRVSRNSQAIKHSEKFHSTDAVVWAPVRSQNKADVPDEVIPKNEVEAVSAVKTEHKVQNSSKNKRAEMERYVPKPVAKEMAHQGSTQQPVASVINQTAINETIERSDSGSQVAESSQSITLTIGKVGIAIEPRHGSSRQSKHGKAHGSWKDRGTTESTAMHGSEDGPSYASNVDKNSVQNHQPQKPDVVSEIEQPKSYDWNDSDGWNMPEEPVAVAPVSVSAKDQGNTRRGKQHPFKGHRAMGNNHDLDEKNNSRGDTYKNNNQFSASETGQTDLAAASRENRVVGERAAPHWQPKSQAHSGNSQLGNWASGGQNVVVEVGRTFKKETSPRGAVPRPATPNKDNTEYVAQYQHDQVISERNNAGEGHSKRERKASFRGRPHSPMQGHVTPVETAPVSMDTRQEQHFNTGFRKNGNQNSRFGRGQESRGDWNYSGHDSRQHNHPANRERQRHSPHFEYQPVGPNNSNNKFNNSEEPRDGSYNTGGRVKERGQTHPRRGGGNFHGRQSGASQVDADMEL